MSFHCDGVLVLKPNAAMRNFSATLDFHFRRNRSQHWVIFDIKKLWFSGDAVVVNYFSPIGEMSLFLCHYFNHYNVSNDRMERSWSTIKCFKRTVGRKPQWMVCCRCGLGQLETAMWTRYKTCWLGRKR